MIDYSFCSFQSIVCKYSYLIITFINFGVFFLY